MHDKSITLKQNVKKKYKQIGRFKTEKRKKKITKNQFQSQSVHEKSKIMHTHDLIF